MALDRHKALEAAERLLKQGKVQAALGKLEQLAAASPHDPVTLNRMGDLLARQGRRGEAVGYYHQIATQFASQGFYPKAVAIYKKILRVDPNNSASLAELGELYLKQKLPGEARRYLLRCAELHLQAQEFTGARIVYERLVAAEPHDARHRARLAEARAAEGDTENAALELVGLGRRLLDDGACEEADKAFRRSLELLPGQAGALLGVAACMTSAGRDDAGLAFLEAELETSNAPTELIGDLLLRFERAGRQEDAIELLRREGAPMVPAATFREIVALRMDAGSADSWWEQVGPVFVDWSSQGHADAVAVILDELVELELNGYIPALRAHYHLRVAGGDRPATVESLERLIRAHQARTPQGEPDTDDVRSLLAELRKVAPHSTLLGQPMPTPDAEAEPIQEPAMETVSVATQSASASAEATPVAAEAATDAVAVSQDIRSSTVAVPVHVEAPAVPLNKGDEEFVSGRLTQADILEKYGLREQALQQIREVAERFPGHVATQRRLTALLRDGAERSELRDSLIALALAQRAAGDATQAREAAGEAMQFGSLDESTRQLLEQLDLVPSGTPTAAPSAPAARAPQAADDDVVLIDFDQIEDDVEETDSAQMPAAAAPPAVRTPNSEVIDEIRAKLAAGRVDDAREDVQSLRSLGYSGAALEELEESLGEIDRAAAAAPAPAEVVDQAPAPESDTAAIFDDLDDDDDLSAITAALESELFAEEAEPIAAEAESEQSLEDVFAAFKQHVQDEISPEDYQTHYDLGIGYKEMGLVDEAIGEFRIAICSEQLHRQACAMLATCHGERQELTQAIDWYRKAIDSPGSDDQATQGLRYELAEVLLQSGDREAALGLFRDVMQADPSYRDVQDRINELESSLS